MKLLHVDSSILGGNSASRAITAAVVARLVAVHPGLEVTTRDLGAAPLSHLSGAYLAGQSADVQHDQALQEDVALGGSVLAEFLAADIVVIGVPMYNFTIPSQLKSWVDRVLVSGKTFRYGENGPEGLAGGKRVILAVTRGGVYSPGAPHASFEHQLSYMKTALGFVGLPEVEVLLAEGLAFGPEPRQQAIDAAVAKAAEL